MTNRRGLEQLNAEIVVCRKCPRLVEWRERVALEKRAAFADWEYWGRPLPGFGDPQARILIVGLAPAAHGGNRTGRIFTGDRSGDFLFEAVYRSGLSNQPTSVSADDGLHLRNLYIAAVNRCCPPANRPTVEERDNCLPYLVREIELLDRLRVLVPLGAFAWDGALLALERAGHPRSRPRPKFGHGAEATIGPFTLLGSFHPSQQNTFTGKLTAEMLGSVLSRAIALST
ncbi:MAG TPA: uracil-DNA glycosylase [Actinomycetota bacterium]|nr:uracil-DNA glycosylase [Actinomycetota bacterium]